MNVNNAAWEKMLILEDLFFKWHLEAFACELFIYIYK